MLIGCTYDVAGIRRRTESDIDVVEISLGTRAGRVSQRCEPSRWYVSGAKCSEPVPVYTTFTTSILDPPPWSLVGFGGCRSYMTRTSSMASRVIALRRPGWRRPHVRARKADGPTICGGHYDQPSRLNVLASGTDATMSSYSRTCRISSAAWFRLTPDFQETLTFSFTKAGSTRSRVLSTVPGSAHTPSVRYPSRDSRLWQGP